MIFPKVIFLNKILELTPEIWEKNWDALTRWWNNHDQGAIPWTTVYTQNLVLQTTVLTAAGNYSFLPYDVLVVVNKTVGAATTVTLPANPQTGRIAMVKDGKGDAAANNITVQGAAGNIDGAATYVMNANYRGLLLAYNGTQWNKIALF
jgi:hypothetical protein